MVQLIASVLILLASGAILMTVRRDDQMGPVRIVGSAMLIGLIVSATLLGSRA